MALITMDDNGGLPIKCSATRADSRVTHASSRFRKYDRAACWPVSANERSYSQSAESCKSAGAIHQGKGRRGLNDGKLPRFALEINNNRMRNPPSLECIKYPGLCLFTCIRSCNWHLPKNIYKRVNMSQ